MPYIALKLMDIRDHPVVLKTTSVVQKLLDHILEDESTLANCFLKADGDVHQMKRCFAHSPGGADAISYVWDLHAMIIEQVCCSTVMAFLAVAGPVAEWNRENRRGCT